MRTILFSLFFVLYSCLASAQMQANLAEEIDKILYYDVKVDYEKTPGFIIGIIVGDSTFVLPYGSIRKDSVVVPQASTLYEIGGLTKVFTASLIDLLVKDSLMSYDSSLNTYLLPEHRNPNCERITIGSLLTHTSGLPKMPFDFGASEQSFNNPYEFYSKTSLLDFYLRFRVGEGFGKYNYSHVGFALLQEAIEQICQKPFDTLLRERILLPAGLIHTWIEVPTEKQAALATGYAVGGMPVPYWTFQSFEASEGLKSNMEDLLTFLRLNIDDKEQVFSNLHERQAVTELSKNTYAAYGWHIIKLKKYYDLLLHQGSTSGFRCSMGFVKETRMGVVILSNSEYGLNGLGYLILRMLNNNWKKRK